MFKITKNGIQVDTFDRFFVDKECKYQFKIVSGQDDNEYVTLWVTGNHNKSMNLDFKDFLQAYNVLMENGFRILYIDLYKLENSSPNFNLMFDETFFMGIDNT